MGGCAAPNCANSSHSKNSCKKRRVFTFPKDEIRRNIWIRNCRRDKWTPSKWSVLCEDHFESNQFENSKDDGIRKLKKDAIPTIFDVPNPTRLLDIPSRQKGIGLPKVQSTEFVWETKPPSFNPITSVSLNTSEFLQDALEEKSAQYEELLKKHTILEDNHRHLINSLKKFLSSEQIEKIEIPLKAISSWNDDSVVEALKMRFALGKHGYCFLRKTGYPLPSYSTLNRRIQGLRTDFGVLFDFVEALKVKVSNMPDCDKECCLSIDEMEISGDLDFDTTNQSFVGGVSLGDKTLRGKHYIVVLLRGLKSPWKQIVAHEVTGPSTSGPHMKELVDRVLKAIHGIGLKVVAVVSDMGSCNKSMWNSYGVSVSRNERAHFSNESSLLYFLADVPHLIKSLRNAFLSNIITLPIDITFEEDLPTQKVSPEYVKNLFFEEISNSSGLRSLHHLQKMHLYPSHFAKMKVSLAVQLISIRTAAALEAAVSLETLPQEALTTAWWIRLFCQWFEIMSARRRKTAITKRNASKKFQMLEHLIEIVQHMEVGKGWKPIQTGIIMSTLSVIKLSQHCFNTGYQFFLLGRLTQDALENVFSQIRRKAGNKPSALQAKQALKLVCVSQFIAEIKTSNYTPENDTYFLNVSKDVIKSCTKNPEVPVFPTYGSCTFESELSINQQNNVFYIASAAVNCVLKRNICRECKSSLQNVCDPICPGIPEDRTYLAQYADMGGLCKPSSGIFKLALQTEDEIQRRKRKILSGEQQMSKFFINAIIAKTKNIVVPMCCNIKEKFIKSFIIIRGKGLKNHEACKRKAEEKSYSSSSQSKKLKI